MSRRTDTATRTRRLLALLPHLKRGQTVRLAELAAAVGADESEVAADLSTLTMCGVPPFTPFDMIELDIDGDSVTVYVDPPALGHPLRLTAPEARALASALDAAGYPTDHPLRAKLLSAASAVVSTEDLERTVRAGTGPGGGAEIYAALAGAADEHRKVRITYYTGATGAISRRVVHPWALVTRRGIWYLVAWCEDAGEERVFRLDRIREIHATGEVFTAPDDVPVAVTPAAEGLPVAEIRFDADASLPDARVWPGVVLEMSEDGSTIARIPYQTVPWIARRVASYLGQAEVVSPPEVRRAVRELASGALRTLG